MKLIFLLFYLLASTHSQSQCPSKCICRKVNEKSLGLKVKCGGLPQSKILNLKEVNFSDISYDVVQLDLSLNHISSIDASDFLNFTSLRKLDLSQNSLKQIDPSSFGGIATLEKLKLSLNLIVHIGQGSFDKLIALKQLDISSNPLACDCDLLWLVPWSTNSSVKLQPAPKCETPIPFKDSLLKKLKVGTDLHCESPLQPLIELQPDTDQILFEGDSMIMRCRAPRVAVGAHRDSEDLPARAHLFWGWSDQILEPNSIEDIFYHDPAKVFPSISIDARHLSDSGLLDSILTIPRVSQNHTGTWDCRLRSQQANLSHSIAILVISEDTEYCKSNVTLGNKGQYSWPETVRNRVVRLPCAGEGPPNVYATHNCTESSEWIALNTDECPYIRETTKVLEQFSKVNLSIARGSVLESAKRLRNYTNVDLTGLRFHDPMDIVFIAKTITNYLDFVNQEKDLSSMLLDIVSQLMEFEGKTLQSAQSIDRSCTKIIRSTEIAAGFTSLGQAQKSNLALEQFKVRADNFPGITCAWYKNGGDENPEKRIFQCNTAINGQGIGILERHIDAVIQIPSTLFGTVTSQTFISQQLLVSVFQNSRFFPRNLTNDQFEVTSCIIGATILNKSIGNLSDPIYIMLRAAPFHHELSTPSPVWWDPELNDGAGGWSFQGCYFSQLLHGRLVFACNRLGYYGLLQNTKYLNDFRDEFAGARFRLSPPALYIGGIVLFICTWINIASYLAYDQWIQMARRTKHSLINSWLALSFLSVVFTLGIYQTENYKVCQSIGICIHYFSLCVLLWICVGVSNMYKRISRHDRISLPTDELPRESLGRKPILGLYLVGWGIALIICGISGAVNIREYAAYSYCFLKSGPALSALFVPAGILIGFLTILFICIRCSIRVPEDMGHMSEGTQGTENVDLDLLEPTLHENNDRCRSSSISTPTTSTQDDLVHSNSAQLKAYIIVIFLYVLTWITAAISVATPFSDRFQYEEELFSIVYAILATLLGLFLNFFYGFARSDVRTQWSLINCRNIGRQQCWRSRSVSDTNRNQNNTPPVMYHQATGTLRSISRSNSQCSKTRQPVTSTNSHRAGADLNMQTFPRNESPNGYKMSGNVNLVMLHRQQFLHNSVIPSGSESADIFYNPNQINVARKFFKKQKRLQKRNNFELQRQREQMDCRSETSSVVSVPRRNPNGFSMFSSEASKVNNTNIHFDKRNIVDRSFRKDGRQQHNYNPNMLSDSCNENDLIDEAEQFVIGAERLRALAAKRSKVNNTPPTVAANIYTNVPETSQPQHEIVTIRADEKFKKTNEENRKKSSEENSSPSKVSNLVVCNQGEKPHYANENFKQNQTDQPINELMRPTACLKFDSNAMVLSLDSPISAMNTIGLPISPPIENVDNVVESVISLTELKLDKDTEYISSALEISCVHPASVNTSNKSKSLNDLLDSCDTNDRNIRYDCPTQSTSCTNLPYIGDSMNAVPAVITSLSQNKLQDLPNQSHSPILFSPSLCDIDDLPSPSLGDRQSYGCHAINLESTPTESESNLFFNPEKIFHPVNRNFTASPTSESDINYQNSELSIRSHELYAPQQDNELNITLTGGENLFPYQPSEISDFDEDNDMDIDYNNCSNDCLLDGEHEDTAEDPLNDSQSSIDELYQQITRRSIVDGVSTQRRQNLRKYINENEDDSSQCSIVSYVEPNGELT